MIRKFEITQDYLEIERSRFIKVKKIINDYDGFNIITFEDVVPVSLAVVASNYINYGTKWQQLQNMSLMEWLEKNVLCNVDLVI